MSQAQHASASGADKTKLHQTKHELLFTETEQKQKCWPVSVDVFLQFCRGLVNDVAAEWTFTVLTPSSASSDHHHDVLIKVTWMLQPIMRQENTLDSLHSSAGSSLMWHWLA